MIEARPFGPDTGTPVTLYTLDNGSIAVRLIDRGATIVGIDAPGRDGARADVVLGFDEAHAGKYYPNDVYYFGATVGPSANRVERAEVPIAGRVYRLVANEGANNLHTDPTGGLHAQLWQAAIDEDACAVTFTCTARAGEHGLPGNRAFTVRYELDGPCLRARYMAESDAPTFFNLTNHTYFNLAGQGSGTVRAQELQIAAERYLPIDGASIPTGELRTVAGTPFDFRAGKPIGQDIDAADEQLALARGYDHCFCIDGYTGTDGRVAPGSTAPGMAGEPAPRFAVRALDPASGRGVELYTTLPGVQLYTGNYLDEICGKQGSAYTPLDGFALEPEFYPATPSHPAFPQAIFGSGAPYLACNEYRFFTR